MNATSLHELQTERFISEVPTSLVLRRKLTEPDNSGGRKISGEANLEAQTVRVVGVSHPPTRVIADGRSVTITKTVVGMPDFDVAVGDTFLYGGSDYEVVTVQTDPAWRVVAEVTQRA